MCTHDRHNGATGAAKGSWARRATSSLKLRMYRAKNKRAARSNAPTLKRKFTGDSVKVGGQRRFGGRDSRVALRTGSFWFGKQKRKDFLTCTFSATNLSKLCSPSLTGGGDALQEWYVHRMLKQKI